MHINSLPDDCLRPILELLSLREKLRLRIICTRWCSVLELLLAGKRILKLFGSVDNQVFYDNSVARYNLKSGFEGAESDSGADLEVSLIVGPKPGFTESGRFLPALFPNITHLIIYCLHLVPIDVPHLLEHFPTLTSLTLFGLTKCPPEFQQLVWSRISALGSLKRLHLFGMYACELPPEIHPILSQLEHFSLNDSYNCNLVPLLRQLRVQRLHLEWVKCAWDEFSRALGENQSLAQSLTHLTLGEFYPTKRSPMDPVEILPLICGQFPNLVYLDLRFVLEVSLVHASQHLSRLTSLTDLRLVVRSSALDNFNRLPPTPLPSIKTLHLTRFCICHYLKNRGARRISLRDLFPAVEQITVRGHCFKCLHDVGKFCFDERLPALKQCQVNSLP